MLDREGQQRRTSFQVVLIISSVRYKQAEANQWKIIFGNILNKRLRKLHLKMGISVMKFSRSLFKAKFHFCAPPYDLDSQKSFTHEFNNHHKD